MDRFPSKQIGFSDFGLPAGVTLSPENRWVKKADVIPWEEIKVRYAALFQNRNGNVAKPLRLALGALIIQTERRLTDEETALQIQETPCLQYFCGMREYKDEPPFDPSLMVYFRKRLTAEILGEINELMIAKATAPTKQDDDNDDEPPNDGTLIVDATCAPQNIRYPQDTSLLNEARENPEQMVDELHDPAEVVKPRTYRKNAGSVNNISQIGYQSLVQGSTCDQIIADSGVEMLHIHIFFTAPLDAGDMTQSGADQHKRRVAIRERYDHSCAAADLTIETLNDIVCASPCPMLGRKISAVAASHIGPVDKVENNRFTTETAPNNTKPTILRWV